MEPQIVKMEYANVNMVESIQIVMINVQGQETVMEMQHAWQVNANVLLVGIIQTVKNPNVEEARHVDD